MKKLKDAEIHNLISFDKFMEGNNKPFKRIVTAYLINELREKYKSTFNRRNEIADVTTSLSEKLVALSNYYNDHYERASSSTMTAMMEVAEKYNLYDFSIYYVYKEVKELLERFEFIEHVIENMPMYESGSKEKTLSVLTDLFKYHKYRVNSDKYVIMLNEETKPALSEEEVTQLVNN
jgi:hypothetical protein